MTKKQLINKLIKINKDYGGDEEIAHSKADDALLEYIDDDEVKTAFDDIDKWYA